MAITIYKFPQPYLELELVAGGSLPVDDYYFLGWFQRQGGYYHCAHSPVSEEQTITTTSGNQSIKVTWWAYHDDITAFADAGGGQVTVTSAGHGRSNSDEVKIIGTTNYNGTYTISNVTTDTFEITETWNGDDATGKWLYENGIPTEVDTPNISSAGICFKWDNYSMINSGTGLPYKWLNMNDPANSGKDEYDESYGHRKWTQGYPSITYTSGGNATFTAEGTGYGKLSDGSVSGSSYASRGSGNVQVAYRYGDGGGKVENPGFEDLDSKLYIYIDDTDTNNNLEYLKTALEASGYTDHYKLYKRNGNEEIIMIAGHIEGPGEATWTDCTLITSGGWMCPNITYDNMVIKFLPLQYQCRTSGGSIQGIFKNSVFQYNGTSMDLYPAYNTADNMMPYGDMTFYDNCEGYTFNRGTNGSTTRYTSFQFRYPNDYPRIKYMKDVIMNGMFASVTYIADPILTATIPVTNVQCNNNGISNYDFSVSYSYLSGKDCDFSWDLTDVSSNRANGQIICYFGSLTAPDSYSDVWYSRYNINLTVLNSDGTPVEDAEVVLVGEETDSDTTDSDGQATVTQLGYTVTCPPNEGSTYKYGTNSDWYKANLTVTKAGYGTYKLEDIEIREGQDWTIVLPASGTETKIYDSILIDSTIY